jgi:hypothetical protein
MYSIQTSVPLSQISSELSDSSLLTDTGTSVPTSPASLKHPNLSKQLCGHPILQIYEKVRKTGLPNYKCARVPLPSNLNIHNWKKHLQFSPSHSDLLLYLEYGFPINYMASEPPVTDSVNHSSANKFPEHIVQHIQTELEHKALLGPFPGKPFVQWTHTSPLMTREKKGSHQRRIITDMSWPLGASVNSAIPRDQYQGKPARTVLPTLQDIIEKVRHYGQSAYMASIDISRAYSQMRVDPLDWPLQGIMWDNDYYVATSIQFGSRWGCFACQTTQQAVCDLLRHDAVDATVYVDDYFIISKTILGAQRGFQKAMSLTDELGIDRSVQKDQLPTQILQWIGYLIDTVHMTVSIPPAKIRDIIHLLDNWKNKLSATRHELQSILGKLHYISRCCHPARLFVGRMLETLRTAPENGSVLLTSPFKCDITWFQKFLPHTMASI